MTTNRTTSESLPTRHDELTDDGFGLSIYCEPEATYIYVTLPATIPAEWEEHGVTACQTREYVEGAMSLPEAVLLAQSLADVTRETLAAFPNVLATLYAAEDAVEDARAALAEAERALQDAEDAVEDARP